MFASAPDIMAHSHISLFTPPAVLLHRVSWLETSMLSIASGMETLLQTVSAKKGSLNSLTSLSEQSGDFRHGWIWGPKRCHLEFFGVPLPFSPLPSSPNGKSFPYPTDEVKNLKTAPHCSDVGHMTILTPITRVGGKLIG